MHARMRVRCVLAQSQARGRPGASSTRINQFVGFWGAQEKNVKHTGNITFDDIINIARVMRPRSCAKDMAGVCKEMLGTAVSVGCTVDRKHPSEVINMVRRGRVLMQAIIRLLP